DNPYKYNAKEFDVSTGYYYYGARYYDPKRSFWLSVDPLEEITNSPYAYVWNDPVNFADPTGMMGERVGGRIKDWYRDRLGNVSWYDSQEDQIKGKNGETLTRLGKSGSYVNTNGTTTYLNRDRTVTEGLNTSSTLKPTQMSGAAMYGNDAPQISSSSKRLMVFAEFDTTKYYPVIIDRFAASGFHPALTDPSAKTFELYAEGLAGGYLFKAFRGVLFYDAGIQYTKVGHWSTKESYIIMSEKGVVVPEQGGLTFFSTSGPEGWTAAPKGWVYSEMEIQSNSLIQAGTKDWLKAVHPESAVNGQSQIRAVLKKGGQLTPPLRNLTPILKTKL
ncbi:hypothetical protein OF897_17400, partial [Chryseobacterium formosus]